MAKKETLPPAEQAWVDARKRHRLSHGQVQMARELGRNPKRLSKIDDHQHKEWKAPLPEYIEALYLKRFGKAQPDSLLSIEARVKLAAAKKSARRLEKNKKSREPVEASVAPKLKSSNRPREKRTNAVATEPTPEQTLYQIHLEPTEWSSADYELSWDAVTKVLRYHGEGRDNPRDLWGFDHRFPPSQMDEFTLADIERFFGPQVANQVRRWVG